MKTTQQKIYDHIRESLTPLSVKQLKDIFNISNVMIHRHLKMLQQSNKVLKHGSAPKTFYSAVTTERIKTNQTIENKKIEENWLTITPQGERISGIEGFEYWCNKRGFIPLKKEKEYISVFEKYNEFRHDSYIDATEKFKSTFPEMPIIKKAFYLDFFSYEVFGRTKWGQLVLHAKLSEDKKLLQEVYTWATPLIQQVIKRNNISLIGYIPHSLQRKNPFIPGLKKFMQIPLFEIPIFKTSGEIIIAQKTLKKSFERIENAEKTIFISPNITASSSNVLLIDDAVGSGATLQKTAEKLYKQGVKNIYVLALVGSINGFEVISEV